MEASCLILAGATHEGFYFLKTLPRSCIFIFVLDRGRNPSPSRRHPLPLLSPLVVPRGSRREPRAPPMKGTAGLSRITAVSRLGGTALGSVLDRRRVLRWLFLPVARSHSGGFVGTAASP